MANHIRYVSRRPQSGIFYYCRRVPQVIQNDAARFQREFGGSPLFRRSLRTRNQVQAMKDAEAPHREFETKIGLSISHLDQGDIADNATRRVTRELLAKIQTEQAEKTVDPWARRVINAEQSEHVSEFMAILAHERELEADELRKVLFERAKIDSQRIPNIPEIVDNLVAEERLDAPPGSDAWSFVSQAVRNGLIEGNKRVDDILAGTTSAIPKKPAKHSKAARLSEVVEAYLQPRKINRTTREVRGALKSFISVVGDLPVDEITRSDFIRFCQVEGIKTVGGRSRDSVERPISPETLQKKIRLLHAAIEHAIKNDSFSGPNPASKLDATAFTKPVPRERMPAKRPITVHEMNLVFQYPWFTGCASETQIHKPGEYRLTGMHFWAPILAALSGCRAGELGGLRASEVLLDHQYPHIVIRDNQYRTTKGSYRRNVPILTALLDLGFDRYVKMILEGGHDRLFPDWKPPRGSNSDAGDPAWSNSSMVRSFNRIVLRKCLSAIFLPKARQEVTFHSLRGAFKTLLGRAKYALPPNYIHEVVGHAKSNLDKRYVGEIPVEETYEATHHCMYEGLVLPSPPPLVRKES